jgi:hypothetical protein
MKSIFACFYAYVVREKRRKRLYSEIFRCDGGWVGKLFAPYSITPGGLRAFFRLFSTLF